MKAIEKDQPKPDLVAKAKKTLQTWFQANPVYTQNSDFGCCGAYNKSHPQTICYAGMTYWTVPAKKETVFYASVRHVKSKLALPWVSFLVGEDSPWRNILPFLVTRDPKEILSDHGMVFRNLQDIPNKELFNFLIASRTHWEFSHKVELFTKCLAEGLSPRLSAYIGTVFSKNDKGYRKNINGGHVFISGGSPFFHISRFLSGEPKTSETMSQHPCFTRCESIWKTPLPIYPSEKDYMTSLRGVAEYVLEIKALQDVQREKIASGLVKEVEDDPYG